MEYATPLRYNEVCYTFTSKFELIKSALEAGGYLLTRNQKRIQVNKSYVVNFTFTISQITYLMLLR